MSDYHGTYLIQALNRPHGVAGVCPFAFGGGGSGLTAEASTELSKLWDFEYMGAAEYEFGAAATALDLVAKYRKEGTLVATVLPVVGCLPTCKNLGDAWWYSQGKKRQDTSVFVIANAGHLSDITDTLRSILTGDKLPSKHGGSDCAVRLKRNIALWGKLFTPGGYWGDGRFSGGLELDNGWFVFIDEVMFRAACAFFSLVVPEQAIKDMKKYVPPKSIKTVDTVDRSIVAAFQNLAGPVSFVDIYNTIYEPVILVNGAAPPEVEALLKQVKGRLRSACLKHKIVMDKKSKCYHLVVA